MSESKNTYKDTLNLPQTTFDMKANLLNKEPALQDRWKSQDLYGQLRKAREGSRRFILHDGPPYANGNIHMGTALNKVLKDMVVRIHNMQGDDSPYVPGWDCHGLPIEQKVMDNLGAKAAEMDPLAIRRRCYEYASKFQKLQSDQFQRLGVMGEFDKPYITMAPEYEAATLEVFARLVEKELVYKQLKPVHWSIENRTALADAELEYYDRQDTSTYVLFKVADKSKLPIVRDLQVPADADLHLLIWTTTPWTLPANLAVAVHPEFEYRLVKFTTEAGEKYAVVADSRIAALAGKLGGQFAQSSTFRGAALAEARMSYHHPLIAGKTCPIVTATYVTLEDGTGLVHTAPGHGLEDYGTGLKNGLPIYCPVKGDGTFDETAPQWLQGVNVWKANAMIVDRLRGEGMLMLSETITHSYPHDWRSKTPTIFRATEQWFISVDREVKDAGMSLRQLAMEACRRESKEGGVHFVPSWGRNRIAGMLESRPDWCISRQRVWGLPIPAFYNEQGQPLLTPASVRAVAATVAKHGSDAWFKLTPGQLLAGYDPAHDSDLPKGQKFDLEKLTAGRDIFDVWFESGSSWFAVCLARGLVDDPPVDLYLEGSDQHRGWFQLSLLPALGSTGKAPFKTVLTHGYVVDETGRTKMSKSLGNVMNVIDQLNKRGADILRLWVATQDYQADIRCGEGLIAQAEDAYRKIRNTLRYCMGSCFDFDPAVHATEPTDHSIDRWMRMELHQLIRDVRQAYDAYEFHKATRLMYEFCTVQASSIYMSAIKDRLYCESPDAIRRRATQTVLHEMLMTLVKLLAPILPHTCEEAWQHIPSRPKDEPASVHMASLPDYDPAVLALAENLNPVSADQASFRIENLQSGPAYLWGRLLELRDRGLVELEALRNGGVKNPLDAEAVFHVADENLARLLGDYLKELEDMLGVGYARIEKVASLPEGVAADVNVFDTREKYKSCARSWKRRPDVGTDAQYPDLSVRDAVVMRELKEMGKIQ